METKEIYEKEVKVVCEVFKKLDIPHSMKSVGEIVDISLENKKKISKLLWCKPENHYRVILPFVDSDLLDYWAESEHKWVQEVSEMFNAPVNQVHFNFSSNRVKIGKQEWKISKLIEKMIKIQSALPKEIFDYFSVNSTTQLFSKIKTSKRKLIISTRPLDILTASMNGSFITCFHLCNEYGNAPISFTLDNFTAIAFMADKDDLSYKIGRQFLHLHDDAPVFQQGKPYTGESFPRSAKVAVRHYIMDRYNALFNRDIDWYVKKERDLREISSYSSDIYLDGAQDICHDKTIENVLDYTFEIHSHICLICGSTIYEKGAYCEEC